MTAHPVRAWPDIPRWATAKEVAKYMNMSTHAVIDHWREASHTQAVGRGKKNATWRFCKGCIDGDCGREEAA
jgi:hypothetical protein